MDDFGVFFEEFKRVDELGITAAWEPCVPPPCPEPEPVEISALALVCAGCGWQTCFYGTRAAAVEALDEHVQAEHG